MATISEILARYSTDKGQSFYVHPYMDITKANGFLRQIKSQCGMEFPVGELLVLFDETVLGTADKGVGLTNKLLLVSTGVGSAAGVYPLSNVQSAEISGLLNKKVVIRFSADQVIGITLTQGNRGATNIVEILNRYIRSR